MASKLVLTEPPAEGNRDLGENVFFENLPDDCKVFAFYYPASMPDQKLEAALRQLAEQVGRNLFVNIGRYNDPQYDRIVARFGITKFPVIVMTAIASLAAPPDEHLTAYVRLDSSSLLKSPDRTVDCMLRLSSMFLQGKVAEAIAQAKSSQRAALLSRLSVLFGDGLKAVAGFLAERDLSISILGAEFELKRN